jgi:N-methylhydantoinase A
VSGRLRLAVDIGGTFTDGVLLEDGTDRTWTHKVLTTPADPSEGFIAVARDLLADADRPPGDVVSVTHATTITTNTLLQRRGARTALLITAGFEDLLEIGRQIRHALYDLQTNKPVPLVPRRWCHPVVERLDYRGRVLVPLDEASVEAAVDRMVDDGIESVAICLLHAYVDDVHERRVAAIVRDRAPGIHVSVSSEIAPQIKEFWRASTTVVNAYVAPAMDRYLGVIEARLLEHGIRAPLHVMGSGGALMTARTARARPVDLVESGPAAGVSAAVRVAEAIGVRDAISFDMGGTTAKVGLILGGEARTLGEFEVGAAQGSGTAVATASGYPILGSIVDLVEVGAGGGSVAWIDSGGLPRVGPRSAGADPGPASYGRGGIEPTVTDANVVLRRLVPENFIESVVQLDPAAAERSLEPVARALGVPVASAAEGVVGVAEALMAEAIRLVSVERGYDPREFTLIAFGGAGPLHANRLAAELGIPRTVIPQNPSVLSALGMLVSDFRHEHRRTRILPLDASSEAAIGEILDRLDEAARASLAHDRIPRADRRLRRRVDARYAGQSWTLGIDLRARSPRAILREVRAAFDEGHRRAYGYAQEAEPVELVSFTVVGVGINRGRTLRSSEPERLHARAPRAPLRQRRRREDLAVGRPVAGPALIDDRGSTTVVQRGYQAVATDRGMLLITPVQRGGRSLGA